MITDLKGLLDAGLELSSGLWAEAAAEFGWDAGIDRYFVHQVSQVHTDAICERLGIDPERGARAPSPSSATSARPRCRSPWPGSRDDARARRPGPADGHRLRAQRVLPRDRLVTGRPPDVPAAGASRRCPVPARPARARPGVVAHASRPRTPRASRDLARLDNGVEPVHGTRAVRARQPDLVLPVARAARRRTAGLARRRPRPPRDGLLRADRAPAHRRPAGRRPRSRSPRPWASTVRSSRSGTTGAAIVSLGWALAHRDQLRGVVLGNTAVAQPPGDLGPPLIRLAHLPGVRPLGCVAHPDLRPRPPRALSRPPCPPRSATRWPCPTAPRADVERSATSSPTSRSPPVTRPTTSWPRWPRACAASTCRRCCSGVRATRSSASATSPTCATGCRRRRLHRFEGASHLVTEDAPRVRRGSWPPGWPELTTRRHRLTAPAAGAGALDADQRPRPCGPRSSVAPDDRGPVMSGARRHGQLGRDGRVGSPSSPPGWPRPASAPVTGSACSSSPPPTSPRSCTPAGAPAPSCVVADKGLGFAGMRRALRGAALDHVVAGRTRPGRRARPWACPAPGSRSDRSGRAVAPAARASTHDLDEPGPAGTHRAPARRARTRTPDCAVVFTSGATGPAKGVVYRHRQVRAQVELVRATYDLRPDDTFVAAFAPFALLGPALGPGVVGPGHRRHRTGHADRAALARRRGRRRRHASSSPPRPRCAGSSRAAPT